MFVKKINHDRRPENCKISISLPTDLRDAVKRIADRQNRKLSNMIQVMLLHEVERLEKGNSDAGGVCDAPGHCTETTRLAAESRPRYGKG